MTTPVAQGSDTRPDRSQSFIDWFQINSRYVAMGAIVIVAAGIGYWLYIRTAQTKAQNAERALIAAKQSIQAGNPALAANDLQKLVTRWDGTRAAGEAAMLLAQMDYQQGKYQDGVKELQGMVDSRSAKGIRPDVYGLIGDGQAQQKQLEAAAKTYLQAADATEMAGEKALYKAKAARAYAAAGKLDEATKLWKELEDNTLQGVSAEAHVRLGELESKSQS